MNLGNENKSAKGRLVLENAGQVVRAFSWNGEDASVIQRGDTRRVEIRNDLADLKRDKIQFKELGLIKTGEIEKKPVLVAGGQIRFVSAVNESGDDDITRNVQLDSDSNRSYYGILALIFVSLVGFLSVLLNRTLETAKLEEELKQQVVKISQRVHVPPKTPTVNNTQTQEKPIVKTTKTVAIKRLGALAVLGSLKSGPQKGGINLGAVNTTAGPGLGGTGGSGGIQTSLYGKGLVSAPVGPGANMQGGGGYGTKGKGGGQAGYGNLSLIGSAGDNPIPLGREAIVAGGLDKSLINDVINRNLGQIRFCYEQGLQGDPSLGGRVAVGFTIGGNGVVRVAGVDSTTMNSKVVEDCILMRLKTWKFPLPEGGSDVKVSYPFVLKRTGQG
jgi:hypothetical protein